MDRRSFLIGAPVTLTALPLLTALPVLTAWPRRTAAAHQPLSVVFPDKSPPNSWQDDDGRIRGILVDLVAELAAVAGYAFTPLARPLPRVQSRVENGTTDAMCLPVSPERLAYSVPTAEPLTSGRVTLFVRRDSPAYARLEQVRSLDDLARADVTVIAIHGNGWIRQNIESRGIRTVFANGTVGTVRMLVGARGDVIVDMSHQINWIRKQVAGGEDLEELPPVMDRVDWPLLISRKSPLIADLPRLNAAIHALRRNGTFDAVMAKYGVKA